MTIVDAINSAQTDHAVYFLVTAYIESLSHFERACEVSPDAIELPVRGFSDLSDRLEALRCSTDPAPSAAVARAEAAAVLHAAVARLGVLADPADATLAGGAMRSERNDSRHSALSV